MKKIIALMMALVMMMAVTVPAFATKTIEKSETETTQKGSANVSTTTDETDATYTVTYPAAFTFAWDDTVAKDANYTVTSQLPIGATLKVSVAADNDAKMTSTNAANYSLTYTLTGGIAEKTFNEINNDEGPDEDIKIAITQDQYDAAVPDVYQGTVTYTVAYKAA